MSSLNQNSTNYDEVIKISNLTLVREITYDADLTTQKLNRSRSFTYISDHFSYNFSKRLKTKRNLQLVFFWVALAILVLFNIAMPILIGILIYCNFDVIIDKDIDSPIILATLSFLTTYLTTIYIIPKRISEYLFNTEEDKHIFDFIKQVSIDDNNKNQT